MKCGDVRGEGRGEREGLTTALLEDQTRTGVKMSWAWLAGTV